MATKKTRSKASSKTAPRTRRGGPAPDASAIACWEDDPGDPKELPARAPITAPVPDQGATPLPFKLQGKAPPAEIFSPGSLSFVYYANAAALRRTADFWGSISPPGTSWAVGKVLPVHLDSGVDLNAFYTRGGQGEAPGLHFFHDTVADRTFFSGESPDVCCHEMGHAFLDAIRPELFDAQSIETAAFHESFGDMSALLSACQVPSFRSALISETGGVLNKSSRLSRLAEQLGFAIRKGHPDAVDPDCLRNAANSFFYVDPQTLPPNAPASHLSSEPHSFSRVFSAAFLDSLAAMFRLQGGSPSPDGLVQTTVDLGTLLINAIRNASVVPDYYSQVAAQLVRAANTAAFSKYRDVLKSAFVRRGILSLQAASTLSAATPRSPRAKSMTAAFDEPPNRSGRLPMAVLSAAGYGLKQGALRVHTASEPKRFAVTGSSATRGTSEPRSGQSAAESYVEDLFQIGRVDVGKHGDENSLAHPWSFKTHMVVEEEGALTLKRTTFDCGFHFAFDHAPRHR